MIDCTLYQQFWNKYITRQSDLKKYIFEPLHIAWTENRFLKMIKNWLEFKSIVLTKE